MVRTKNPESSRCWDWVWIEALSHWMTLWTVSWSLFASAIQQYHWGKGRTSLNTACHAQTLQARLENSKISMLMWKHFLNDSPVTFHFFLKVREWPGSQWGTKIISFVLAGWAPLTLYLQNIRVGLPKISAALKKKKKQCQCWQDRKYRQKHMCLLRTAVHRLLQKFHHCLAEHIWLGRTGKVAKCITVPISGRQSSLTDVFLRLIVMHTHSSPLWKCLVSLVLYQYFWICTPLLTVVHATHDLPFSEETAVPL